MLSAYQQLRVLCSQLRHGNGTNEVQDESSLNNTGSTLALGLLNEAVLEVKGLCLNLMNSGKPLESSSLSCPLCSSHGNGKRRANEDMTLALKQKEAQIRKRDEEIASLHSQVNTSCITEIQLKYNKTENDRTRDSRFENRSKFRFWIFEFCHFPPICVLLKVTCLVTLFDRNLQVFKNWPNQTIFGIFN